DGLRVLKYVYEEVGRKLRARGDTRGERLVVDLETLTQALRQRDVECSGIHQRAMGARGFRLHDRENVRVESFDCGNAFGAAERDAAGTDGLDGVAACIGDRCFSEPENVLDHGDFANDLGLTRGV